MRACKSNWFAALLFSSSDSLAQQCSLGSPNGSCFLAALHTHTHVQHTRASNTTLHIPSTKDCTANVFLSLSVAKPTRSFILQIALTKSPLFGWIKPTRGTDSDKYAPYFPPVKGAIHRSCVWHQRLWWTVVREALFPANALCSRAGVCLIDESDLGIRSCYFTGRVWVSLKTSA